MTPLLPRALETPTEFEAYAGPALETAQPTHVQAPLVDGILRRKDRVRAGPGEFAQAPVEYGHIPDGSIVMSRYVEAQQTIRNVLDQRRLDWRRGYGNMNLCRMKTESRLTNFTPLQDTLLMISASPQPTYTDHWREVVKELREILLVQYDLDIAVEVSFWNALFPKQAFAVPQSHPIQNMREVMRHHIATLASAYNYLSINCVRIGPVTYDPEDCPVAVQILVREDSHQKFEPLRDMVRSLLDGLNLLDVIVVIQKSSILTVLF